MTVYLKKSTVLNCYFFNLLLFQIIFCKINDFGLKNTLEREKDIELSKTLENEFSYIIQAEIEKHYNNKIEIYLSIIQLDLENSISLPIGSVNKNELNEIEDEISKKDDKMMLREAYYNNYNSFLGISNSFFVNRDLFANFTYNHQNTSEIKHLNKSEILLEIVEENNENTDVKYFFMRNIFTSKIDINSCTLGDDTTWLNFYDLNIILSNKDNTNCTFKFDSIIDSKFISLDFKTLEKNDNFQNSFYNKTKNELSSNKIIKKKIERKQIINKLVQTKLLNRKDSSINLKNFLIEKKISQVKNTLSEVIKLLVYVDNYGDDISQNKYEKIITRLNQKINDYNELLDGFDIKISKKADNIYYLLISFISFILIYLIFQTIKEIKQSYDRKIN